MELTDFTGRVALAALLGTLIGLERQIHLHQAGPRTNALVSMGAALFVSLTTLLGETTSPSRIASYVVSGVGFLGGGAILKEGANVRGLTTAAVLWCSAAVGTLAGSGHGAHGAIGTAFVLAVLVGMKPVVRWIDKHKKQFNRVATGYRLEVECGTAEQASVRALLDRHLGAPGLTLTRLTATKSKRRQRVRVRVEVTAAEPNDRAIQEAVDQLLLEPGVRAANWEKCAPAPE